MSLIALSDDCIGLITAYLDFERVADLFICGNTSLIHKLRRSVHFCSYRTRSDSPSVIPTTLLAASTASLGLDCKYFEIRDFDRYRTPVYDLGAKWIDFLPSTLVRLCLLVKGFRA